MFGYLDAETIELESPRVKNEHLKPYFTLAYFVLMLVRVMDKQPRRKSIKVMTPKVQSKIKRTQSHCQVRET